MEIFQRLIPISRLLFKLILRFQLLILIFIPLFTINLTSLTILLVYYFLLMEIFQRPILIFRLLFKLILRFQLLVFIFIPLFTINLTSLTILFATTAAQGNKA